MVTQLCRVIRPMRAAREGVTWTSPGDACAIPSAAHRGCQKVAKSAKRLEIFAPQSTQRESRAPRSR